MDQNTWLFVYLIIVALLLGWSFKQWMAFNTDPLQTTLAQAKTTLIGLALLIKSPQLQGKIDGSTLGMSVKGSYTSSPHEPYYWSVSFFSFLVVVLFCITRLPKRK